MIIESSESFLCFYVSMFLTDTDTDTGTHTLYVFLKVTTFKMIYISYSVTSTLKVLYVYLLLVIHARALKTSLTSFNTQYPATSTTHFAP